GARLLLADERAGQSRRRGEEEHDPQERGLERGPVLGAQAVGADRIRDKRERRRREEEYGDDGDAAAELLGDVLREDGPDRLADSRGPHASARPAGTPESAILCSGSTKSRSSLDARMTGPRVRARATTRCTISRPSVSSPDIGSSRTRTGGSKSSANASRSRCRIPVENSSTSRSTASPASPVSSRRRRSSVSPAGNPAAERKKRRFSSALSSA